MLWRRAHCATVSQEVPLKVFEAAPAQQARTQGLTQTARKGVDDATAESDQSWQQGCLYWCELSLAWHNSPDLLFCYNLQRAR